MKFTYPAIGHFNDYADNVPSSSLFTVILCLATRSTYCERIISLDVMEWKNETMQKQLSAKSVVK